MTTPQNELQRLAYRIEHLTDMFEADGEDAETIFEAIKAMRHDFFLLLANQDVLNNQMNLIIKLLSKDEKN